MQFLDSNPLRPRRPIDLSGASSSAIGASEAILERARQERVRRDLDRKKEANAVVIQAAYRSHRSRRAVRDGLRQQYDALMPLDIETAARLPLATRLLVHLFHDGHAGDTHRLAAWTRAAVGKVPNATKRSLWSHPFSVSGPTPPQQWTTSLRSLALLLSDQVARHPAAPQALLYLEVLKQLLDPERYDPTHRAACGSIAAALVTRGCLHRRCREHILFLDTAKRSDPSTLSSCLMVAIAPFRALSAADAARNAAVQSFTHEILTIPLLASRVTPSTMAALCTAVPIAEMSLEASESSALSVGAPFLLANLVALMEPRIATFDKATLLVGYLRLLQWALDAMPSGSLIPPTFQDRKGKGKATVDEGADAMAVDEDPSRGVISPRQQQLRSQLYAVLAPSHLNSLAASSTRFAASPASRPAFCAFLVSLLYSLPKAGGAREDVMSLLVYGSGGGLLREIWRGWLRSGKLGRSLGATRDGYRGVAAALRDVTFIQEWPLLVLMVELYARTLLTLGDDEFFATGPAKSSRNPLSLDEVIGFSALLRNIAFALYWQEGSLDVAEARVVGTRMTWEELRNLATRTLQQIYVRDSRKPFTPTDHWLMTDAFDLQSFVQSAVVEFGHMAESGAVNLEHSHARAAYDSDEEFSYAEPPRRHGTVQSTAATRRELAVISPRLGVLNNIPFVIPFETRVQVFRQFVQLDREANHVSSFPRSRGRQRAVIRRDHIADDGFAHLNNLGPLLKHRLEISFVDQYGIEEAGIDGGGLFKEFLTSLSKEAFDTDRGLWFATNRQELYPAPHSYAREARQISWYTFLGRIVGKALYEGILVDVPFAGFFLNKWLGGQNFFDDLASLDPEFYNGLVFLKNYTGDVEKDLSLSFSIDDEDFGVSRTIDLIPRGRDIPVTRENRYRYIALVSHYRLNAQIKAQSAAFVAGLQEIIDPRWLRVFNQSELRLLVGGAESPIDLEDLQTNTVYGRALDETSDTVRYFWDVVKTLDQDQRRQLLRFVTSCPRPPLLGFKELYPRFAIAAGGEDQERLPTASTCMNLLKMPMYNSPAVLREKLLLAINAGAGFDLS